MDECLQSVRWIVDASEIMRSRRLSQLPASDSCPSVQINVIVHKHHCLYKMHASQHKPALQLWEVEIPTAIYTGVTSVCYVWMHWQHSSLGTLSETHVNTKIAEPYDYQCWCIILLFSVHASGAAIYLYEWLSPVGQDRGRLVTPGKLLLLPCIEQFSKYAVFALEKRSFLWCL